MRISQREARKLRRRVNELEQLDYRRLRAWSQEWPHGTSIAQTKWDGNASVPVAIRTARKLKHGVVCVADDDGLVHFIALPIAPSEGK